MGSMMDRLSQLHGARVYFDVNPIIYFIEKNADFARPCAAIFHLLGEDKLMAMTSELSLTEILLKPLREQRLDVVEAYKQLLLDPQLFTLTKVTRDTFLQAAELGANLGLRSPDAIHLASAIDNRCSVLITNDRKIRSHAGVSVLQMTDIV
jgi:predicted nucleic acid-binding protein